MSGAPSDGDEPEAFETALAELDALVDEQCAALGFERSESIVAGFSQGAGLALGLGLHAASERPHPTGVLAMSPYFAGLDAVSLDDRRGAHHSRAHSARHQRPADPGAAVARPRPCTARALGVRLCTASTRWNTRSRSRACRTRASGFSRVLAGERPDEPVPDDPVELVPAVTTAQWEQRGPEERRARDRRLLGAVVRPVPSGVADRRAIAVMRGSAYKVVKVNIDDEPQIAQQYDVQSIPMIGLFRNGRLERAVRRRQTPPANRSRARNARHPVTSVAPGAYVSVHRCDRY